MSDGYPIDHIPDRPTKRQEKDLINQMGDFADYCKRLDETHYWDEKKKEFIKR